MQIYNKEPVLVMWDIVKSLQSDTLEIYKETMAEDENDIPTSYLLLRSDMSNVGRMYGDGTAKIRESDCDIILVTKGIADSTSDIHNVNKKLVTELLEEQEVPYIAVNFGYSDSEKNTQYTWSLSIKYIL